MSRKHRPKQPHPQSERQAQARTQAQGQDQRPVTEHNASQAVGGGRWDTDAPRTVVIAAIIAAVQSLAVIGFGCFLIYRDLIGAPQPSLVSDSPNANFVGTGTAVFIFIVFGFVMIGAWAMVKGHRWGRGAVVLVELILAISAFQMFSGGSPVLGALTLVTAAAAAYLLMFAPDSTRWFASTY